MSAQVAFPFLVLPDDAVRFGGWMIGDPGQPLLPVTDVLEKWDYARDLEISASVSIDWDAAARALEIPKEEVNLTLSMVVGTGTGSRPRRLDRLLEVGLSSLSEESPLTAIISGRSLSGRIRLSLVLTLGEPSRRGTVLSPQVRGARLWQSYHDILIEDGGDSRFPLESLSFAEAFRGKPQERAPWYLHWRPTALHMDFSATVRLYINSDYPELHARFVSGDQPTLQGVMADVVSQMAGSILDQEDVDEVLAECDEGSVGSQIRHWVELAFPGQQLASVKALRDQNPGVFRAAILAASDPGGVR